MIALKIGVFKEKWLSLMDNYAINERIKINSKIKERHANQFNRAAKSTRTESLFTTVTFC